MKSVEWRAPSSASSTATMSAPGNRLATRYSWPNRPASPEQLRFRRAAFNETDFDEDPTTTPSSCKPSALCRTRRRPVDFSPIDPADAARGPPPSSGKKRKAPRPESSVSTISQLLVRTLRQKLARHTGSRMITEIPPAWKAAGPQGSSTCSRSSRCSQRRGQRRKPGNGTSARNCSDLRG